MTHDSRLLQATESALEPCPDLDPCPELETLEALVHQQLPPEAHQALLPHLEACLRCQDLVQDLQHFPEPPTVDSALLWGSALLVGLLRLPTPVLQTPAGREAAYDALAQRITLWGGRICPSPDGEELLLALPVGTDSPDAVDAVEPARLQEALETLLRALSTLDALTGAGLILATGRGRLAMPPMSEATDRVFEGADQLWPTLQTAVVLDRSVVDRLRPGALPGSLSAEPEGWSSYHPVKTARSLEAAVGAVLTSTTRVQSEGAAAQAALPQQQTGGLETLPSKQQRPLLPLIGRRPEDRPAMRGAGPRDHGGWSLRWRLLWGLLAVALLLMLLRWLWGGT